MKYESAFNSGAIGDGGTSGGLFQHHASRFTAMKNYVGDDWKTNWKKQIDFALTESDMKTYLGRNFANARDASMGFTSDFERPANTAQTAAYRASTADGYASAMEGRGGEPAGGQTPGGNYTLSTSGSIVPRDRSLYDSGNEEQCATLSKGFNPDIGRSSTWTVVPGQIKPGVVVATMRYNLPGGDRTGSGYHTGVALSAPDEKGNFLLLDQSNGNAPKVRTVNANSYSGGSMGGKTSFGLISSGGRLHDEQSLEALKFAADRAGDDGRGHDVMGVRDPQAAPLIEVWNKIDLLDEEARLFRTEEAHRREDVVLVSALTGEGTDDLAEACSARLTKAYRVRHMDLGVAEGAALAWVHAHGRVLDQSTQGDRILLSVRMSDEDFARFNARYRAS
jgi:hypothetical protein